MSGGGTALRQPSFTSSRGVVAPSSGGGTAVVGRRPASASADRSTSTDIISAELISPDLTAACPPELGAAAVFRPIRRPYGTVSSQEEDFSYFDTEDDEDDDLRYNGSILRCPLLILSFLAFVIAKTSNKNG